MLVTVTGLVVVTGVVWVTVAGGRAGGVVSTAVVVWVVSCGVVGMLRVGVVRVAVGSVAVTDVEIAACSAPPPPPHPGIRSAIRTARKAVVRVGTTASTVGGRPQGFFMQNG